VSSNVLSFPNIKTIFIQNRNEESMRILSETLKDWKIIHIEASETVKADAALTCMSVLM
jgi:hypothetical protein